MLCLHNIIILTVSQHRSLRSVPSRARYPEPVVCRLRLASANPPVAAGGPRGNSSSAARSTVHHHVVPVSHANHRSLSVHDKERRNNNIMSLQLAHLWSVTDLCGNTGSRWLNDVHHNTFRNDTVRFLTPMSELLTFGETCARIFVFCRFFLTCFGVTKAYVRARGSPKRGLVV